MSQNKRFIIYLCSTYIVLVSCALALYFLNPFNNSCIQGDCKSLYGIYVYHSGMKYEGNWENGYKNGYGTLFYPNGASYSGEWKNNSMHGKGIKITASQKYSGEWKHGHRNGEGTNIVFKQNSREKAEIYTGEWEKGLRHGKGTYISYKIPKSKNSVAVLFYEGGWGKNLVDGYGTATYSEQ